MPCMSRPPKSIQVFIHNYYFYSSFLQYILNGSLQFPCYLSDLPKDAPVFNVDVIINLDTQKLQTETTSAKIVGEIQDWLLTHVSSHEMAVLLEDKMQWLLVGVCIFHHSKILNIMSFL